jgi:ubiquinone/menaquinone biosynthesis C-methylase UbiE
MVSSGHAMTARSAEESATLARFAREYERSQTGVMLDIERGVCGCNYGSTSWATLAEVEQAGEFLELGPGKRLLDLGAGSGWPGLYLALKSGCDVTLADIPLEGLRIAARRATADEPHGAAWIVASDGARLPFKDRAFDAIEHSDVLCCLEAKTTVLSECRRVVGFTGKMIFSVISIAPALSGADNRRAAAAGPPFKAVTTDYPGMIERAGWKLLRHDDRTAPYLGAIQRRIGEEEANEEALVDIVGRTEFADMIARRRRTVAAINDGLLLREVFAAHAA